MEKVEVLDRRGKEFTIKVTTKYLEIQVNGEFDSRMPITVCDSCLRELVDGHIQKGGNFVIVGPLVYIRHFYIRGPYMKCQVCGRRTAQLRFVGLLHCENGQWFYLSKHKDFEEKEPFEERFKKAKKQEACVG